MPDAADDPFAGLGDTPARSVLVVGGPAAAGGPPAARRSAGGSSTSAWTSARSAARPTCCAPRRPPEFQEHWQALQREGLLAARSLIDHYIQHLESQRAERGARRGHPD